MQTLARLVRASGFRAATAGVVGHGRPMAFSTDYNHRMLLTKRSRVSSGNEESIEVVIVDEPNNCTDVDYREDITTKEFGDPQLLPDILRKEIRTYNGGDWVCINSTTSVWCDINDTVGDAFEMMIPYDDPRGTIPHLCAPDNFLNGLKPVVAGCIDYHYAKCIFYKDESYKTVLDFANPTPALGQEDSYIFLEPDTKLWKAKQLIDEKRASMSWFTEGGERLHDNYFKNTEFIWTICSGELRLTSRRRIVENRIWLEVMYPIVI